MAKASNQEKDVEKEGGDAEARELGELSSAKLEMSDERLKELVEAIGFAEPPSLKVKLLRSVNNLSRAHEGDAGMDIHFQPSDGRPIVIRAGAVEPFETGVAVAIPEGFAGLILPRSGLASKRLLAPINTPGLIDSGYRGELIVALVNHGSERQLVTPGERIAQLVIVPFLSPAVEMVDELDETERGAGGFGSSGS